MSNASTDSLRGAKWEIMFDCTQTQVGVWADDAPHHDDHDDHIDHDDHLDHDDNLDHDAH